MTQTQHVFLQHTVEASARRAPEQIAVVDKERSITYAALETKATQFALMLQTHGVNPGDRVGLWLEKSIEALVAILGILKAGAAYVPLDPQAPVKRVQSIMNNCGMSGLVTSPERLPRLTTTSANVADLACIVMVEGERWSAQGARSAVAHVEASVEDVAYILYTSGSTGEPKGVTVSHRAALAFVDWASDYFDLRADDRVSNHAPFHFDLSIFDLFATMKVGATIVFVPGTLMIFPRMLADFISSARITTWYSVPSALIRLVLHGHLERYSFAHLRQILFAGEVFPPKYLRQLQTLDPRCNLL